MTLELRRDLFDDLDTIEEAIRSALVHVHTALPGRITSYDPTTQTATVQILTTRRFRGPEGEPIDRPIPPIVGVPIVRERSGGYVLTLPIEPGDPCLILFAERDLSTWSATGEQAVPPTPRRHDLGDAICIPGLSSRAEPIVPAPASDATQIRSEDGSVSVTIGPGRVAATPDAGATEIELLPGTATITLPSGAQIALTPAGATMAATVGLVLSTLSGPISLSGGGVDVLQVLSDALEAIATATAGGDPLSTAADIAQAKTLLDQART